MRQIRLGMLTPSSNTVVEPVTSQVVASLEGVSAHYSRFPVTEIALSRSALAQFDSQPFMASAQLLADARMHVIAWNGTSAAWRGFQEDAMLCEAIGERFGARATASMLALNLIMQKTGVQQFGLVTPYIDDVQAAIVQNYQQAGYSISAEQHMGIQVNYDFSQVSAERIRKCVLAVAQSQPAAVVIVCTNLPSAHLIDSLEQQTGLPIYDSTLAAIWHALRLAGCDTTGVTNWGSLFVNPGLQQGEGEPVPG